MLYKGQITVFFSLIFLVISTLLCSFIENARTAGTRWYLQMAMNSSAESLFSNYHEELWNQYFLFGLEIKYEAETIKTLERFLNQYLEVNNWYQVNSENVKLTGSEYLTGDQGHYLEEQILDYMKYILWSNSDYGVEQGETLLSEMEVAKRVFEMVSTYQQHSQEAMQIESVLEKIEYSLTAQESIFEKALTALDQADGALFGELAEDLEVNTDELLQYAKEYSQYVAEFQEKLGVTQEKLDKQSDEYQNEASLELEQWMGQYKDYGNELQSQKTKIENLMVVCKENQRLLSDIIQEVEEGNTSAETDEADETDFWNNVKNQLISWTVISFQSNHSIQDKDKKRWLETIMNIKKDSFLNVLVPEGTVLSQTSLPNEQMPSEEFYLNSEKRDSNVAEQLLVSEYLGRVFSNFQSLRSDFIQYEIEYLLSGQLVDDSNLELAINKLMIVREGLNLTHLILDPQKRESARTLAAVISGLTGIGAFTELIAFFVLAVWALGESIIDLRTLLQGGQIPFVKRKEDWYLDLEGLLQIGKTGAIDGINEGRKGLTYQSYLKILLLLEPPAKKYYRAMDLIQINIKRKQIDFLMKNCAYSVDIKGLFCGKHLFLSLPVVEKYYQNIVGVYHLTVTTQNSY